MHNLLEFKERRTLDNDLMEALTVLEDRTNKGNLEESFLKFDSSLNESFADSSGLDIFDE